MMKNTFKNLMKVGGVTLLLGTFSVATLAKGNMERMIKALELTPEQTTSMKAFQKEHKNTKNLYKANRMKVKALLDAGDIDGAATLAAEQASARVYDMAKAKAELATFLSNEQIEKLEKMKQRKMKNKGKKYHQNNA